MRKTISVQAGAGAPKYDSRLGGVKLVNTDETQSLKLFMDKEAMDARRRHGLDSLRVGFLREVAASRVKLPPPPPRYLWESELRLTEDEGRSVASGTASGEESAWSMSNLALNILKPELLDMPDESPVIGASGVVLGLSGDGHRTVKRVDLSNDIVPPQCLSHQLGQMVRTGILDCNPRYDRDGKHGEGIGVTYGAVL